MLLNMKKMTKTMKKMTNFVPMYAPTCVPNFFQEIGNQVKVHTNKCGHDEVRTCVLPSKNGVTAHCRHINE